MKRGQSGIVLQHTATDVLVKLGSTEKSSKGLDARCWAARNQTNIKNGLFFLKSPLSPAAKQLESCV